MTMQQTQPRDNPDPRASVPDVFYVDAPSFLVDWKSNHRALTEAARAEAGKYIFALTSHEVRRGRLTDAQTGAAATAMWRRFREFYDDLRGLYAKSDAEDARKAMSKGIG